MSLEEMKFVMRQLYRQRGYFVVGQPPQPSRHFKVGDEISDVFGIDLGTKFEITRVTTEQDWDAQWNQIAEIRPGWQREPRPVGSHFFRVRALAKDKQGAA